MEVAIKFQLTWNFPEIWDTNGESHFIPKVWIEDKSCGLEEDIPCNIHKSGLGNNMWSLDNDLRFDTQPGHILAIELRDGKNHYNPEFDETLIGAGQALRFSGKVIFSEDETPAPPVLLQSLSVIMKENGPLQVEKEDISALIC